jgi:RimJ/RimL family protein N-acetyltransferase
MASEIKLRALTYKDIKKTLEWHNSKDIKQFYSGHPFPVNIEKEKNWYDKILKSNFPVTVFGIEIIKSKKLIGVSSLRDIDLLSKVAEFGIYIGDIQERGKGFAELATKLTLKFGFFDLGLNRIFLRAITENKKAVSLFEKCGFKKEGILRQAIFKKNIFYDEILMSMLKEEFDKNGV